jgi:hypothetical protein
MAEKIPQGVGVFPEGYKPNSKQAILEVHRLVCIFLASKPFASLRDGNTPENDVIDCLQECEEDEITRILLTVAITARVIDDLQEGVFDFIGGTCGTLLDDKGELGLSLREACNKIIHATKVHFDVAENEQHMPYVNPVIYLYGKKYDKEWKATLDVLEFARKYVTVVRHY